MLGKEKLSLVENTLVAHPVVKDCVRIFGFVTNVPITEETKTVARIRHVSG